MSLSHEARRILDDCKLRSDQGIEQMREAALNRFGNATEFLIGVNGSYARREATEGSDVDLFFLETESATSSASEKQATFRKLLKVDLDMRLPASQGVFEKPLPVDKICEIGGLADDNETLTRRMLLLLEGEWVFNKLGFYEARRRLLEKYLYYRPEEDKICMFLLNDVIRYWRTICIDLEHKVYATNKAREIRLIKLRFSRMLLYASGVLAIGEGHGLSWEKKLESLHTLLGKYPIDRIESIVGEKAETVFGLYAGFLEALNTPAVRRSLDRGGETQVFKDMSNQARLFRDSLHCLFRSHFVGDNPTLRALLL